MLIIFSRILFTTQNVVLFLPHYSWKLFLCCSFSSPIIVPLASINSVYSAFQAEKALSCCPLLVSTCVCVVVFNHHAEIQFFTMGVDECVWEEIIEFVVLSNKKSCPLDNDWRGAILQTQQFEQHCAQHVNVALPNQKWNNVNLLNCLGNSATLSCCAKCFVSEPFHWKSNFESYLTFCKL